MGDHLGSSVSSNNIAIRSCTRVISTRCIYVESVSSLYTAPSKISYDNNKVRARCVPASRSRNPKLTPRYLGTCIIQNR